jgi:hypothetical protein
MATTKMPMKKGIILVMIAGLLVLLLYMYYVVGIGKVVSQFEKTNLYYYAAAFLAALASVLFFALTWHRLLANLSIKIKIRQVLLFVYSGIFIDSLVPEPTNITGDLLKAYLVSKATGENSGKTTASVITHKTLGLVITVSNLVAGLLLLALSFHPLKGVIIFAIVVLVLLSLFVLLGFYYVSTRRWASERILYGAIGIISCVSRGRFDSAKLKARADELLNSFHEGIQILIAKPRTLVKPMLLSIISWAFDVSTIFLVFLSIGYPVTPAKVLIVYALTGSLQSMGISFVGVIEVIMSALYTILRIPSAVSLTATLLSRFITFWFNLIIAYGAFQYAGLKLLLNQAENKTEQKIPDSNAT